MNSLRSEVVAVNLGRKVFKIYDYDYDYGPIMFRSCYIVDFV